MGDIGQLFDHNLTGKPKMTAQSSTSPATSTEQPAGSVDQMQQMLQKLMATTVQDLKATVKQELGVVSKVATDMTAELEKAAPIIEAAAAAAAKVEEFDGRFKDLEERFTNVASRVDEFEKPTEAPAAAKEGLFQRYGMIAGQAAMCVATLGAIIYSNQRASAPAAATDTAA